MNDTKRTIRCAIYTRKSSEEGLEQEFNSLDAQYEACSAYIVSQKSEGWKRLPARYDDGGVSGGTLERPALHRLLADIDAGRIDLVVVYKIDRLTRSLMDFSKLVERFDKSSCSFVSVTQAFNTSTSMGRLTLNVLLSFAQFEREVTAERIRDKIAASKKKGMWMGGNPPIGYNVKDKELVVDTAGAALVRKVFDLYLDLKCLNHLKREVDRLGFRTRPTRPHKTGGQGTPYSRGHLHAMLTNPTYTGEIRHKDQRYPGRHKPIIEQEIWDKVQALLASRSQAMRGNGSRSSSRSPLTGRIIDETGDRMTPTQTNKRGHRLRYYVSRRLVDRSAGKADDRSGWRLPAGQLEGAVAASILQALKGAKAAEIAGGDVTTLRRIEHIIADAASGKEGWLLELVHQVRVTPGCLEIVLLPERLAAALGVAPTDLPDSTLKLKAPFHRRRRGVETKLILGDQAPKVDPVLLRSVARGRAWWEEIRTGKSLLRDIAQRENVTPRFIAAHLDAAFLAPDIVAAIIDGRQPTFLSAQALRTMRIPSAWSHQRALLAEA